ncbi:beta-galactosidase [Paludibacterium yongneupense]|uniref:beta-galactosidase n=1 Tax=Paludibacterium yongneupense TaxID=400061 RepID=UPI0003F606CC|nr:beta-galactosidase [Paludibacterium yongneupense]
MRFLKLLCCIILLAGKSWGGAPLDKRFFGFHGHELFSSAAAFNVGFGSIRLWDTGTSWRDVEPEKGRFDFSRLDEFVRIAGKNDLKVTLTLGSTPQWASLRKNESCAYGQGCAAPPADIEDWKNYVATVVSRYKGRIECYESWNEVSFPSEPALLYKVGGGNPMFYSGTIAQLVDLQKVVYEQVKAIDPKACVLSPSFHSTGDWVRKADLFMKAGGGRYFDNLSFHLYFGDWPERMVPVIARLRAALDHYGLKASRIYNTEVGIPFDQYQNRARSQAVLSGHSSGDPANIGAALILRTYLTNAAFGVDRVYWYAWDDGVFGMEKPDAFSRDGEKRVFGQVVKLLEGQTIDGCAKESGDRYWTCRLHSAAGKMAVYWTDPHAERAQFKIPATARSAYLFGREGGQLPAGSSLMLGFEPVVVRF